MACFVRHLKNVRHLNSTVALQKKLMKFVEHTLIAVTWYTIIASRLCTCCYRTRLLDAVFMRDALSWDAKCVSNSPSCSLTGCNSVISRPWP